MIYLIDDNQFSQREDQLGVDYINSGQFDSVLKSIQKIEKVGDLSHIAHLSFLNNADCILLHSSFEDVNSNGDYISGSGTNAYKIIELISVRGENIPMVTFSGGAAENISFDSNQPRIVQDLKKSVFYERLPTFLNNYKHTDEINLTLFVYGSSYKKEQLRMFADRLLHSVRYRKNNELIKLDQIPLKTFQSFLFGIDNMTDFDKIIHVWTQKPITVLQFKKRINQLLKEINDE